jgi:hypothetical protein
MAAWTVVHAPAQLADGIPAERTRLVSILAAAYHAARPDHGGLPNRPN